MVLLWFFSSVEAKYKWRVGNGQGQGQGKNQGQEKELGKEQKPDKEQKQRVKTSLSDWISQTTQAELNTPGSCCEY